MPAHHPLRTSALVSMLAVTCGVVLSGCSGSSDPEPGSSAMTGTLRYETGSVPPPYHYELTLELADDEFTLVWSGYDDEVGRTTGTPVDLDSAREILDGSGLLEGDDDTGDCTGGAQAEVDLVVDDDDVRTSGGTCGGEGGAGDVADAIRAVAGDDVVDDAIDEVESAS